MLHKKAWKKALILCNKCGKETFNQGRQMCGHCYQEFRRYFLHNKPAEHCKLVLCEDCGRLKKHSGENCCESCWKKRWYIQNQEKRLNQERERRVTFDKKETNEKHRKYYYKYKLKKTPELKNKDLIRKYTNYHRSVFIAKKNGKCDICCEKGEIIHHKKYTKMFEDWMLLCRDCHSKIHRKYNKIIVEVK